MPHENKERLYQGTKFDLVDLSSPTFRPVYIWLERNNQQIGISDETKHKEEKIEVIHLADIRSGCCTDAFNQFLSHYKCRRKSNIERCFSIHYYAGDVYENKSLIAHTTEDAELWQAHLRKIIDDKQAAISQTCVNPEYWIKHIFWKTAGSLNNGDMYLTLKQCAQALKAFNVVLDDKRLSEIFQLANDNPERYKGQEALDENEFLKFYQLLSLHPALDKVFYKLVDTVNTSGEKCISPGKLLDFVTNVQGLKNVDEESMIDLIERHQVLKSPCLTREGFRSLMLSETFDIRIEEHRKINQPMDRPITEYWQKASHNTYVIGDQLTSKSTIEGYRMALLQNCVGVEIDLWNGKNGEPVVTHGNTLVKQIRARDVLEDGILPYAFKNNDYPIILSLEDHLSTPQREIFIKQLSETFGDRLYIDNSFETPSPEDLKGKILVKQKNDIYGNLANVYNVVPFPMRAITKGTPINANGQISSLSEHKIQGIIKPTLLERFKCDYTSATIRQNRMREYTARANVRVYPGFHRQLSGNFNPTDAMNVGVQMAAMNVQTKCEAMAIYDGHFRANGDCGFALKPRFLLDPSAPRMPPKLLTVTIISGQNLPRDADQKSSAANPIVEVVIDGVSKDKNSDSTHQVRSNGFNPVWNYEMKFTITCPELAVVLFSVKHVEWRGLLRLKYTLGSFALPLISLAPGYRHVSLQDKNRFQLPLATLFVKVSVTDACPFNNN